MSGAPAGWPSHRAGRGCGGAQMFKRVFQLTQQQPIDECLALLGDCLVADLGRGNVEPIVTICRTTVTDLSARPPARPLRPAHAHLRPVSPPPLGCATPALRALAGPPRASVNMFRNC
jgi:hypothetical protein